MRKPELVALLRQHNLPVSGRKAELEQRLREFNYANAAGPVAGASSVPHTTTSPKGLKRTGDALAEVSACEESPRSTALIFFSKKKASETDRTT